MPMNKTCKISTPVQLYFLVEGWKNKHINKFKNSDSVLGAITVMADCLSEKVTLDSDQNREKEPGV